MIVNSLILQTMKLMFFSRPAKIKLELADTQKS